VLTSNCFFTIDRKAAVSYERSRFLVGYNREPKLGMSFRNGLACRQKQASILFQMDDADG
jgi:hypothetical protein